MISVIVIFHNEEEFIEDCIRSILNQSYKKFELILLNDNSSDKSEQKVKTIIDNRIRYFKNDSKQGISLTRNTALSKVIGEYTFFTDADCVVDKNWLKEGLSSLLQGNIGVEGKTIYQNKAPTLSDKIVENHKGGMWMTCNIGYYTNILRKINGFKIKYGNMMEDRDLALRVKKYGKIIFNDKMVVYHKIKKWNFDSLIKRHIDQAISSVHMYKENHSNIGRKLRFHFVLFPTHLIIIICPLLLIIKGFRDHVRSFKDLKILIYFYVAYILERFYLWKTAWTEKVLIL
jgi:glycosyltransferase involved in cell wall biosynthesis